MVAALVCEGTGGAEHLDDGYGAQYQKDNPYHFVAFQQVFQEIHITIL
jgi:hypothetical protein